MNLILFFFSLFFVLANNAVSQNENVYDYTDTDHITKQIIFNVNIVSTGGLKPTAFSLNQSKKELYVVNYGNDSLSVIDTIKFSPKSTCSTGIRKPVAAVNNKDGSLLYVLNASDAHRSIIELTIEPSHINRKKITNLSALSPMNILMSADDSSFYIADMIGNMIYKINVASGKQVAHLETARGPTPMALSKDGQTLYVANTDANTIIKINTETFKQEGAAIFAGGLPYTMILSPDGKTLYVGNRKGNSIIFIDTQSFEMIGEPFSHNIYNPRDLAISKDGKILFVANKSDNSVTLVDTTLRQVIGKPIKTDGDTPLALCLDQTSDEEMDLYIANYNSHTVAKICIHISPQ